MARATKYLRVRRWDDFQHYKDRKPLWIKLYVALLNDWEFSSLTETQQAQLMKLWLYAAGSNNKIPIDEPFLRRALGSPRLSLGVFVEAGFLEPWKGQATHEKRPSRYIAPGLREAIFKRDDERCVDCDSTRYLELDHVIPVSKGGTSVIENLQVRCRSCNRRKRTRLISEDSAKGTAERLRSETAQVATQVAEQNGDLRSPETETEKRKNKPTAVVEGSEREPVDVKVIHDKGFHVERLIEAIGTDADERTPVQVRSFVAKLPASVFERIREQILDGVPRHRGKFAHAELKREVAARSAA